MPGTVPESEAEEMASAVAAQAKITARHTAASGAHPRRKTWAQAERIMENSSKYGYAGISDEQRRGLLIANRVRRKHRDMPVS